MAFSVYLAYCALFGFGVISTVMLIGRPRKPATRGAAVVTLFVLAVEWAGVSYLYQH